MQGLAAGALYSSYMKFLRQAFAGWKGGGCMHGDKGRHQLLLPGCWQQAARPAAWHEDATNDATALSRSSEGLGVSGAGMQVAKEDAAMMCRNGQS